MKTANRELLDRLAAEYALGTLRGRARKRFERWLLSPQVAALVKAWEDRLAGLAPPLERVAPPPAVWRNLENRLELRKLERRPAARWIAIAASLTFFALMTLFFANQPDRTQPVPQLAATQAALIQADPATIYWRVHLLGDRQEVVIHVDRAHALDAGKALELWVLPAQGKPVSLGLLPVSGEAHRTLTAAQRAALVGAQQLAVSLEPEGGSPTGLPTGPVLHVAALTPT